MLENSLIAVQHAWVAGADAVEVDVRVADSAFAVLAHDVEQVPRGALLTDLLNDTHSLGYLVLDVKETQEHAIDIIVAEVGQSPIDPGTIVFQSDEISTLQKIRHRLPNARLNYVHRLKRAFPLFRKPSAANIVTSLEPLRVERVSLKGRRFIDKKFLAPFLNANIGINIWTINNMKTANDYRILGVAGVITDEVRLLNDGGPACEQS